MVAVAAAALQLETALDLLGYEPSNRNMTDSVTNRDSVMLTIIDYRDDLAPLFHDINAEWINALFVMEDVDRLILENPRETIIDPGGIILFVAESTLGIVGTCALKPAGPGAYELTKMGVLESARGKKAGEYLLAAAITRARTLDIDSLFLLTNHMCASAIHLYEKAGFVHDAAIMQRYGGRYARCDVAMSYPLDQAI